MPARNTVFTDFHVANYNNKKKNNTYGNRKQFTPNQEIPERRDKHRYRRCLIGACVALTIIIGIILAGLLPALIVNATRSSNSGTTAGGGGSGNNTGGSSGGNSNGSNSTSVASTSSGSSTSSSGTTISAGSSSSTSTSAYGFTAGGAVLSSTTAWYGYEEVTISLSVDLIDIIIYITVQKTVNATYYGSFSTFWGGTVNQSYIDTGSEITYTWTIVSGQTIQASGSPFRAQAQFKLYGLNQTTSNDRYNVTATTVNNLTHSVSGTF